jgi:hypothetical protein
MDQYSGTGIDPRRRRTFQDDLIRSGYCNKNQANDTKDNRHCDEEFNASHHIQVFVTGHPFQDVRVHDPGLLADCLKPPIAVPLMLLH